MAAHSTNNPTLLDWAKRLDPQGNIDTIVEIMNQENPMLEDAVWAEGNLPTGHRTTIRTGLPEPTWRKLYGRVKPTKSRTAQVTESCGMLEAYAEVDKALADLNGNTAAFRLSEDRAHIEGMAQELSRAMIYSNEKDNAEEITGLAPRYNSLTAENALNILNGGGSGSDNTSIWLVTWGDTLTHGIFPKGSKAGLQMTDKGHVTSESSDGNMEVYRTHYRQDAGLVVRDWRYNARICNIDVSTLTTDGTVQNRLDAMKALVMLMIQASERIPNLGKGRACWYVNRTIRESLRIGILEKIANNLSWESVAGKRVMTFDDIPVRRLDAIVNNEATVS